MPIDQHGADLLFQVVSRRYERKSVVITTNLAFAEWPTIFPNAGSAIALIDRLVHHAEILNRWVRREMWCAAMDRQYDAAGGFPPAQLGHFASNVC